MSLSDAKSRATGVSKALAPISAFARIKPLDADKTGGTEASKRIVGWEEGPPGVVKMSEGPSARGVDSSAIKVFDHLAATLPPEATQASVYEVVARPLVQRFLSGYDVDLLSYGQTGSGKTFTMFGPPRSMEQAAASLSGSGLGDGVSPEGILREEHGFILRSGFEALAFVAEFEKAGSGARAVLHGSMVEMSIVSFSNQSVSDLLNGMAPCYVDADHHLQGAKQVPIRSAGELVAMAAAVEGRSVRGTKMNDTSSRSHCVTTLTLSVVEEGRLRQSRLQFFDLMGSERFSGANAAHDSSKSSQARTAPSLLAPAFSSSCSLPRAAGARNAWRRRALKSADMMMRGQATEGGWEGIYANLSLTSLSSAVELAAKARRQGRTKGPLDSVMVGFLLTKLLMGSLAGNALTGMVTCLSQARRNGEESYLSLKYGAGVAKLLNNPAPQPPEPLEKALAAAQRRLASSEAVVAKGVQGKYQALRQAEVAQYQHDLAVLRSLSLGPPGARGSSGDATRDEARSPRASGDAAQ